jgi:hypothetical protein
MWILKNIELDDNRSGKQKKLLLSKQKKSQIKNWGGGPDIFESVGFALFVKFLAKKLLNKRY